MKFTDFHFDTGLEQGIESMNFEEATPVQEMAIPVILANRDLIACAQTGTGKTAAYLLPIMDKILRKGHGAVDTLILVPTRELAVQIDNAIQALAYFTGISSIAVYGGNDGQMFEQEKKAFRSKADIIVATPGRLISHLSQGYANFDKLEHLVLDEADRMLDMGFIDDIMRIISYLPKQRQNLMFSATMPPKIRTLAKKILHDPGQINIAPSKPAEGVTQQVFHCTEEQKIPLLREILKGKHLASILIFASTREKVKRLEKDLRHQQYDALSIHSDLEQDQRKEVLRRFSNKALRILIATDILSRGIDIESIDLVINFDVPRDPEDYVHRVGRTARAASKGLAITFVTPQERRKFEAIESLIGYAVEVQPLPEGMSSARPHSHARRRPQDGRKQGGDHRHRRQ